MINWIRHINEDDTLNAILEQNFQNLFSQETSVEAPISQMGDKELQPLMADSEANTAMEAKKEGVIPAPMVMASSTDNQMKEEKDAIVPKREMAKMIAKSKKPKSQNGQAIEQSPVKEELIEFSSLIEKDQNIWKPINRSQSKKLKSDQWRTIIIQNKRKLDYTIFPEVYDTNPHWAIKQTKNKLEVSYAESNNQPRPAQSDLTQDNTKNKTDQNEVASKEDPWKFVVQVMSTDRLHYEDAVTAAHRLVSDGYYAYVYRTKDKIKEKLWYRVRVGYFKTPQDARAIGQEIYFRYRDKNKFLPQNYWAVIPSEHELSTEIVNMDAQNSRPWILELPLYQSRSKALKDLPKLEEITELAYVSSRQQGQTTHYRIRGGFYETQGEAQRNLGKLRKLHPALGTPKIIKL